MKANDFVVALLRSPLHVFVSDTLLITVVGRRTGRKITLPVNYYRDGDELWIVSTRTRAWWRNVRGGAEVGLRIRGRDWRGIADVVLEPQAVALGIGEYVRRLPQSARALGVRVQNAIANPEDTFRVAQERLFVKVRILNAAR
jgi:deazaflavin-dependent oxidoreductase (nitroreductase family)